MSDNVILIGFSGTGKSAVGRELAAKLGRRFVDTDDQIAVRFGKSIARIFAEDGEARFREVERELVGQAAGEQGLVVSLGGGAVVDPASRRRILDGNVVVLLDASPEIILRRLRSDGTEVRPMLAADDPLARIRSLKVSRAAAYAIAHLTVDTDALAPPQVADRIAAWLATRSQANRGENEMSEIAVGQGILATIAGRIRQAGLKGRVFVFSDDRVFPLHGQALLDGLQAGGCEADACVLPAGEATKSLEVAFRAYDWLVERRAERVDAVLALGGGVIGDLAGFVAATYLRGLPLVQAPTTLLAQIDSAIGGKVAVNHPRGKNLVGAFYPARLVVVDTALLRTLPRRDLASGWAEIVKTAMILDEEMLGTLERHAPALLEPDLALATEIVRRSVQHKVDVVAEDPKEQGRRIILNYGHTIAHALEAATGYGALQHGEAVAIGMVGAAEISCRLGLLDQAVAARQERCLSAFGLPLRVRDRTPNAPDPAAVVGALALDKKVRGRAVRWVLLEGVGRTTIRSDVPAEMVREVVEELL